MNVSHFLLVITYYFFCKLPIYRKAHKIHVWGQFCRHSQENNFHFQYAHDTQRVVPVSFVLL